MERLLRSVTGPVVVLFLSVALPAQDEKGATMVAESIATLQRNEPLGEVKAATDRLIETGKPAVLPVAALLDDARAAVRRRAYDVLERIGAEARGALPALSKKLDSVLRWERERAAGVGLTIDETRKPMMLVLARGEEAKDRVRAVKLLLGVGDASVVPPLLVLVRDGVRDVEMGAVAALGDLGAVAKAAVPTLIEVLFEYEARFLAGGMIWPREHGHVEESVGPYTPVGIALTAIGPAVVQPLIRLYPKASEGLRIEVLRIVSAIPGADVSALGLIVRAVKNGNRRVRRASVDLLVTLVVPAKDMLPVLLRTIAVFDDSQKLDPIHYGDALRRLSSRNIQQLGKLARGGTCGQRLGLVQALGSIPTDPVQRKHWPKELKELKAVLLAAAEEERRLIAPAVVGTLARVLQDRDADVRLAVLRALAKWSTVAALAAPDVVMLLTEDEAALRSAAASALGSLGRGDRFIVTALTRGLADADSRMRRATAMALGRLGDAAKFAESELRKMFAKEDDGDRVAAFEALLRIGLSEPETAELGVNALRGSARLRGIAIFALRRNRQAVPHLLRHSDVEVLRGALEVVWYPGGEQLDGEHFVPLLSHKELGIRSLASHCLLNAATRPGTAVPRFKVNLAASHSELRQITAKLVAHFGSAARDLTADVALLLKSDVPMDRRAAALALSDMGQGAADVLPQITESLKTLDGISLRHLFRSLTAMKIAAADRAALGKAVGKLAKNGPIMARSLAIKLMQRLQR